MRMRRRALARGTTVLLVIVTVCAPVVLGATVAGLGAAQDSFALRQAGECIPLTPLTGPGPVVEYYDYETPYPRNPYTNSSGTSFSSIGTVDVQRPNTSIVFLYRSPERRLSLVLVHGRLGGGDGGSATFVLSNLPARGRWTVKDDRYEGPKNFDNWTHSPTGARIDWTWYENRTDGGAYSGLGDRFAIEIDPAFNEDAALAGRYYNGTVTSWEALSGRTGQPDRAPLNLTTPATITSSGCA